MRTRHRHWILGMATGAIAIAGILMLVHERASIDTNFPVEQIRSSASGFEFISDGLIPEERISVAHQVRQQTRSPISRVIVDHRNKTTNVVYAFIGSAQGTVYTLTPNGIDGWQIASDATWHGDPREYVLTHHP